ncbi:DEKNAAC102651 [Brettanomyces naardenensis]|uniref:DEKNAAC102651 n=1 Tax=Brettanomyces naardenensis TaxID=13370 RepID=A0A448YLD4_BRENA|nr:DEKNAAC102651 [Brettanomyces naardenensis]
MARKTRNSVKSKVVEVDNNGIGIGDSPTDLWEKTRAACKMGMVKAFLKIIKAGDVEKKKYEPEELADTYEQNLYGRYKSNMNHYKGRFRKDLIAMRNPDTEFAAYLLEGRMSMEEFCTLKEEGLISKKQKRENNRLLERELRNSITEKPPEKLSDVPNQNTIVRDKWGISESAAKVDPRFDN